MHGQDERVVARHADHRAQHRAVERLHDGERGGERGEVLALPLVLDAVEHHVLGQAFALLDEVGLLAREPFVSEHAMHEHAAERVGDAQVVAEHLEACVDQIRQLSAAVDDRPQLALPCVEVLEDPLDRVERAAPAFLPVGPDDVAVLGFQAEGRRRADAHAGEREAGVLAEVALDLVLRLLQMPARGHVDDVVVVAVVPHAEQDGVVRLGGVAVRMQARARHDAAQFVLDGVQVQFHGNPRKPAFSLLSEPL